MARKRHPQLFNDKRKDKKKTPTKDKKKGQEKDTHSFLKPN